MRSRFLLLIVSTWSSLVLSKPRDVIAPGVSCLRWSRAADGRTRVTFLREEGITGARALYAAAWSGDRRPAACELSADPLVTDRYRALCSRSRSQGQTVPRRLNVSALLTGDAPCARVDAGAPKFTGRATEAKARRKRAWILPGTLWCGRGSGAVRYEQLGMFENADRCCREHDHCLHIIPPFRVNYGVFNPNVFTVSHCDCDQRFRLCLLGVNDTISSMVGYSFFNILRVPCFELKQQRRCTEMYWWGMCKIMKEAPYAVFKSPLPYNTSDSISNNAAGDDSDKSTSIGQHVAESPVRKLHRKSQKRGHGCGSRDPFRGDTFTHTRTKGKGCKRHSAVAPSQMPAVSMAHTTAALKMGHLNVSHPSTNKKRDGKIKSTRKSIYPTRTQVPLQVTTNSYPQTFTTTKSIPSLTQKPTFQPQQLTAITAVTKTKKASKDSHCCRSRMQVRGDTFHPRCKSCLEQETHRATVTPATTINASPVTLTRLRALRLKKPEQDTLWNATTFSTLTARKKRLKTAASRRNDDNAFLCGSLKHLDDCKFKIPPLEKKYDLKNMESKTAYHCDCTSRLAVQLKSFKQPSILPSLLKDFVSQYCFKLPKEKKCHSRKSCPGGFAKASDLLQTLKKIKVKDTTGVQNSGTARKRGIPVRLYKRCLRLEREADIMAQLTLL